MWNAGGLLGCLLLYGVSAEPMSGVHSIEKTGKSGKPPPRSGIHSIEKIGNKQGLHTVEKLPRKPARGPKYDGVRKKFSECFRTCMGDKPPTNWKAATEAEKQDYKDRGAKCQDQCGQEVPEVDPKMRERPRKMDGPGADRGPKRFPGDAEFDAARKKYGKCYQKCTGHAPKLNWQTATDAEKKEHRATKTKCSEHCKRKVPEMEEMRGSMRERKLSGKDPALGTLPPKSPPPARAGPGARGHRPKPAPRGTRQSPSPEMVQARMSHKKCVKTCMGPKPAGTKRPEMREHKKKFEECRDKCDIDVPELRKLMDTEL